MAVAVHPHMHAVFWLLVFLGGALALVYTVLFCAFIVAQGDALRSGADGALAKLAKRRMCVQHMRLLLWLRSWPSLEPWVAAALPQPQPQKARLQHGGVLVVGSGQLAQHWRNLTEQFDPLPIESFPFAATIDPQQPPWTPPYLKALAAAAPRLVLYYTDGEVDIGKAPQTVLNDFRGFVQAFRAATSSQTPPPVIVFLSVLASPFQRSIGPSRLLKICAANSGPWGYAKTQEPGHVLCVDLNATPFASKEKHYLLDSLHLNQSGYRHVAVTLRPLLTAILNGTPVLTRLTFGLLVDFVSTVWWYLAVYIE